jgi:two-component system response regulator RegA
MTARPQGSDGPPVADLPPPRGSEAGDAAAPEPVSGVAAPLLLVEGSPGTRACLQRALTGSGFTVTAVPGTRSAEAAAAESVFAYAVVNMRLGDGHGLSLVRKLRGRHPSMWIVVVTDVDSFASVILALRAGANDYLAKPISEGDLIDALLGRASPLPPVPETPLGLSRTCWEHVMRVYEQCGRNVSETARRLGMHRRSLQRVLSKRAPLARGPDLLTPTGGGARPSPPRS